MADEIDMITKCMKMPTVARSAIHGKTYDPWYWTKLKADELLPWIDRAGSEEPFEDLESCEQVVFTLRTANRPPSKRDREMAMEVKSTRPFETDVTLGEYCCIPFCDCSPALKIRNIGYTSTRCPTMANMLATNPVDKATIERSYENLKRRNTITRTYANMTVNPQNSVDPTTVNHIVPKIKSCIACLCGEHHDPIEVCNHVGCACSSCKCDDDNACFCGALHNPAETPCPVPYCGYCGHTHLTDKPCLDKTLSPYFVFPEPTLYRSRSRSPNPIKPEQE